MNNHNVYAIVLNEEVINLIVAENIFQASESAKAYDFERASAVECTDYKCSIGDYYIDGIFYYKDRETQIPNTSVDALLNELAVSNDSLNNYLNEVSTKYSSMEQSIMTLLQSNVDIEIALCELAQLITESEEV